MRVLVTGAMGLLGRCVMEAFASSGAASGTYHSRPHDGYHQLDIGDPASVEAVVGEGSYTHIIHCAANRDPESCLRDPENAYRTNALGVEYLARAANMNHARLIQISTDYVFDGSHGPYAENATPEPINLYGRSKLAGEYAAKQAERHLIVRIPALWRTDLNDLRNVATKFANQLHQGERLHLDTVTVRYYTLADDVARALRFLVEQDLGGIIHLSAQQTTSKADFARRLARAIGASSEQVVNTPPPPAGDARPHDSHLAITRYAGLKGPPLRGIDEALDSLRPER